MGDTESEKKDAIDKAEVLFTHVAEDYFKQKPPEEPSSTSLATSSSASVASGATSALLRACSFTLPAGAHGPDHAKEDLKAEIRRYLGFEGGLGDLQNPLAWWKVLLFPSECLPCPYR
jgi:hypothetical protein